MTNNVYGIDLGTCNMKIYCKASNKIMNEKNTIALVNKNEMYAYGDDAYAMYEKAPETIQVTFPVRHSLCHCIVLRRRGGITAGMIVHQHNLNRTFVQCSEKNLAR